ncbi:cytochrome P450 [Micromonospora sp. NPDC004551]|uniref:cytochrome P450 n=1 Tax=Micromonospora sp. NPDC004551 TaxID=3154284 RepID=UPI0033B5FE4D
MLTPSGPPPAAGCPARFPFAPGPAIAPPAEYTDLVGGDGLTPVTLPSGSAALLVTRHADVRTVLGDPRFSRAAYTAKPMFARERDSLALALSDPPDHTRRRRAVAAAFTARRARDSVPRIRAVAAELIADMRAAGEPVDLVEAYAVPLPLTVICELLGVSAEDGARCRPWMSAMMSTHRYPPEEVAQAHRRMAGHLADLVDQRWAAVRAGAPADGLLAELARPGPDDATLSRDEAVAMGAGLLMAGYETTANQLASCVWLLLADRSRWERLRADPGLVDAAIEEMVRLTPLNATGGAPHVALDDVPLSAGLVRAGQVVVPLVDAAGRDPDVFADPDDLDLTRSPNPHLGYGHGRHHCLGAPLARVELQVGVTSLLTQLPGLRLAVPPDELEWRTDMFIRGPWRLPVTWDGAAR